MTRREIREQTFKVLFDIEFHEDRETSEQISMYFHRLPEEEGSDWPEGIPQEQKTYISDRVKAIAELIPQIDEKIDRVAKSWKTARMGRADLTILRLAVYEMQYDDEIPVNVAINEAVELAKKFGSDDSGSFVNGVLARLVKE